MEYINIFLKNNSLNIVENILFATGIAQEKLNFICVKDINQLNKKLKELSAIDLEYSLALMDSEDYDKKDSKLKFMQKENDLNIPILCAVPNVQAWVFADDKLLYEEMIESKNNKGSEFLKRVNLLPFPEDMVYPKYVANNLFFNEKNHGKYSFLKNMDISLACARTPSLKNFLDVIFTKLNIDKEIINMSFSRNMNRDIFVNLVKEVVPSDSVIYRSLEGEKYTARELEREIKNGTELGRQYTSDVLRLARDLLKRRSERGEE